MRSFYSLQRIAADVLQLGFLDAALKVLYRKDHLLAISGQPLTR